MAGMATFYKPSQWRGKRQVYRSTDPNEPKTETKKAVVAIVVGFALVLGFWLLSKWIG
jgi:hypothetical protein